jgi:hypothetical protein
MIARKSKESIEQKIIIGFFRGLWWLAKLPFSGLKRKSRLSVSDQKYLISKKNEIEGLLHSEDQIELRHAVMEADKLIDWILKTKGYSGATFADRLRSAEKDIPGNIYNNIWQGHKVRNQIAHEDKDINLEILKISVKKILSYNG